VKTFPIALFLLTAAAVSQSKLPRPESSEQNNPAASSSEVEIVGCLSRQSGRLKLTGISLAEGHLSRSLFGSMLGMIAALPLPHG
jgi:hypothetical protein